MDHKVAEQIVKVLARATTLCNDSLRVVKANDSLGQVKVYGHLVGEFMGHSYANVLAPIWKAFPDLEPPAMKAPYVEAEPTLSPESQAALRAFVAEARTALAVINDSVPVEQGEKPFPLGGLAEVEDAVSEIEAFLAAPRHRKEEHKQ